MKKGFISIVTAFAFLAAAWGQSPEEIVSLMEKALEPGETRGISMLMDIKVPIIGTSKSSLYILGDKMRSETKLLGHQLITFSDGVTEWEYDTVNQEVTIENVKPSESSADASGSEADMFDGITEGYVVTLEKETADAWHLLCKKSKSNKDKDDPGKMNLVVSKKTHLPIRLTTKMKGIRLTLHDVVIGVDPALVTFRVEDYPDARIIDKR